MTIQIKEVVDEIQETLTENLTHKSSSNDVIQNASINNRQKLSEKIENAIHEQKYELMTMNQKIDDLSKLVQSLIQSKQLDEENTNSNQSNESVTEETRRTTLPSIYELKPNIFSRGSSLIEERTGKTHFDE